MTFLTFKTHTSVLKASQGCSLLLLLLCSVWLTCTHILFGAVPFQYAKGTLTSKLKLGVSWLPKCRRHRRNRQHRRRERRQRCQLHWLQATRHHRHAIATVLRALATGSLCSGVGRKKPRMVPQQECNEACSTTICTPLTCSRRRGLPLMQPARCLSLDARLRSLL